MNIIDNKIVFDVLVQGAKANSTGNNLESFVEFCLGQKSYQQTTAKQFKAHKELKQPVYTKQYPICSSIYGTNIKCDFLIFHPVKHPNGLVIECKWQQSTGSVDEKFPYLVHNIKEKYNLPTIILLDGNGYKQGAAAWLQMQRGNNFLGVYSMVQFQIQVNNGLL